jgi:hypothetical protein
VSVLSNGEPKPVASCSTGDASTNEPCPEPDDTAETRTVAHWNKNPAGDLPIPHAGRLSKYDPDIETDQIARQWMQDCLFAPIYPPPEVSRPNLSPKQ